MTMYIFDFTYINIYLIHSSNTQIEFLDRKKNNDFIMILYLIQNLFERNIFLIFIQIKYLLIILNSKYYLT